MACLRNLRAGTPLNRRQALVLNRVLAGMEGSQLTTAKWTALAPCSPDTALRDINGLLALGVLEKLAGGGGDTAYAVRFSAP